MTTKQYDNEKVIFGGGVASISYTDPQRGFLLFFKNELDRLSQKKKIKVLDVGCGAGAKIKALKTMFPNFEFRGCDISRQAIKEARINPSGVQFSVADAQELPYKSGQFDVVVINSVLDHTQKPEKVAKEACRVLKKGGTFLVTDPLEAEPNTIHGQLTRFKSFRKHRKNRCGHIHAFSKKSMLRLVEKAGFRVEKLTLDWFYFAQAVDVIYYPLLALAGKGPEFSLERYSHENKSFQAELVRLTRTLFVILLNIESALTLKIPLGFFAYIKAIKV